MELDIAPDGIVVVGSLDRHHLIKKQQFQYPTLAAEKVTVDLAKTDSIDTSGLAWILKCVSYYHNCDKQVSILHAPKQLIALAQLSNVLALLPLQNAE